MDLYSQKSKSIPQKVIIVLAECILLWIVYTILFGTLGEKIYGWFSLATPHGNSLRNLINYIFSCVVLLRMTFAMFFLIKRKLPVEETFSVPMAFALYYVGFALLTISSDAPIGFIDYSAILIFALGSFLNTCSELQRHFWKRHAENKGRIYTKGLFSYSMHVNYFGDVLWVAGYALLSRNPWAWTIPLFLLSFFIFYNIPKLDEHLRNRYKDQFEEYARNTKKLIPFIY